MGRFDHLATQPARGAADILRWKIGDTLAGRRRKRTRGFVTPTADYDRELVASGAGSLTWIGHASFLVTLGGLRILIDPVLGRGIGPIKRLVPPGIPLGELPPIDVVLVTHNHRDHLDPWSIARLGAGPRYLVPLGNAPVLRNAGAKHVEELDWWQSVRLGEVELTLVPARHWSMRLPWDKNDALWGGWVIRGPEGVAYHSGDTAFFDGFAEIHRRLGGIDWAMLPIGAYEPRWFMEPQHMCPEEAVQAARMLGDPNLVAMHWGTFGLTDEPLDEPPDRVRAAWHEHGTDPSRLWVLAVGESRAL